MKLKLKIDLAPYATGIGEFFCFFPYCDSIRQSAHVIVTTLLDVYTSVSANTDSRKGAYYGERNRLGA